VKQSKFEEESKSGERGESNVYNLLSAVEDSQSMYWKLLDIQLQIQPSYYHHQDRRSDYFCVKDESRTNGVKDTRNNGGLCK
jgi:hypothetical protein